MMRKLLLLLTFTFSAVLVGCADFGCNNEAPVEHFSPDSQWKYVSFDRNCGATTGSNLQISVLPASKPLPRTAGNTFIADDGRGTAPFIAQAEWVSARKLQITYSPKARVFKNVSKVGPVEIVYVQDR